MDDGYLLFGLQLSFVKFDKIESILCPWFKGSEDLELFSVLLSSSGMMTEKTNEISLVSFRYTVASQITTFIWQHVE